MWKKFKCFIFIQHLQRLFLFLFINLHLLYFSVVSVVIDLITKWVWAYSTNILYSNLYKKLFIPKINYNITYSSWFYLMLM
jgi:hypothetical protein